MADPAPRLDHRALVAVILALGIAAAIVIIAIGATFHRGSISENESNLLSTVLGAAIGAVATYLGITRGGRLLAPQPPTPTPPPATPPPPPTPPTATEEPPPPAT